MSETGTYKIRPAGRLILTIGRELIQDLLSRAAAKRTTGRSKTVPLG